MDLALSDACGLPPPTEKRAITGIRSPLNTAADEMALPSAAPTK